MTVNWSAENVDDIETLQLNIVSNTEEDIYTTCITDKENREIVVRTTLNPGDYEVTLVAFDICGENFNSKSFLLNIPEPQITPVQLQVSTVYLKSMSFCTPVAAQCPAVGRLLVLCIANSELVMLYVHARVVKNVKGCGGGYSVCARMVA